MQYVLRVDEIGRPFFRFGAEATRVWPNHMCAHFFFFLYFELFVGRCVLFGIVSEFSAKHVHCKHAVRVVCWARARRWIDVTIHKLKTTFLQLYFDSTLLLLIEYGASVCAGGVARAQQLASTSSFQSFFRRLMTIVALVLIRRHTGPFRILSLTDFTSGMQWLARKMKMKQK